MPSKTTPFPKPTTAIEIWRQEVSLSLPPPSSLRTTAPPQPPASFWAKILHSKPNTSNVQLPDLRTLSLEKCPKEIIKTEMYNQNGEKAGFYRRKGEDIDDRDVGSMDLGSEEESNALGGLRRRAKRLERARRLWDGGWNRKGIENGNGAGVGNEDERREGEVDGDIG